MQHNHKKARYAELRRRHVPANKALADSRAFEGKCYKSNQIWSHQSYTYNPPNDENLRWIENTDQAGLRFVGFADEIDRSIQHTGWYTDEDGCAETLRGAVWQLPGRNGVPLFVAGYCDPHNHGAARICFDVIEGERPEWVPPRNGWSGYWSYCDSATDHDGCREAARQADGIAEIAAESEREWRETSYKAMDAHEMLAEAVSHGKDAIEAIRCARALCGKNLALYGIDPDKLNRLIADELRNAQAAVSSWREQRRAAFAFIYEWRPHPKSPNIAAWREHF